MKDSKQTMKAVKGVKDILPQVTPTWRYVENSAIDVFELYNFHEIKLPIFERTEVFKSSIGETTDIVEKEMYTFTDRGGESLTLRPEGTASAVRAYLEHKMYDPPGVKKLFYFGPMFRAERPQAGRFRQFHQIGAEVFGSDDPAVDVELIIMLLDFFTELSIPGLRVTLNSLGCHECRPAYREALLSYLNGKVENLCDSCRSRIDRNPLRVLDCKSDGCKVIAKDAPTIDQYRCEACQTHFDQVRLALLDLEAPFDIDPKLVRGLDYYTRTAFEVTSENLGAQNAVAGGGRYDRLVERFGGPETPAIGFAIGVERLVSLLDKEIEGLMVEKPDLYILPLNDESRKRVFEIAHTLRNAGFTVERGFGTGSIKSQMKRADRSGARKTIILGESEMATNSATVKDMESGEQQNVSLDELIGFLNAQH